MTLRLFATALAGLAVAAATAAPLPFQPVEAHAAACPARTPAVGSKERKAILDAVRPRVEAMTGKPVEFVIGKLDVACGYARLLATPQAKGGAGDRYEMIDVLVIKRNGRWSFAMFAASEEGSDPAADQFKARYPKIPDSLLYL